MSARSGSPKRAASPKRSPKKKARRPAAAKPRSHPSTADMVNAAIASLKERKGSSLSAIKKYVAANYKVDMVRISPFIRRYLRSAVTSGRLKQTKGSGASGSFRLGAPPAKPKKAKRAKKAKKPKKARKPRAKKAKKPKKKAAKKTAKKASPRKARKSKAKRPAKPKARAAAKPKRAKRPAKAKKTARKSKK